jgi:hypothetical protein
MAGEHRRRRYWRAEAGKMIEKYPELRTWRPPSRGGAARWAFVGICIGALLGLVLRRLHWGTW